mgnify:CR=1 FL=1
MSELTTREKRLKRIEQLQARISKEKARLNDAVRKERTGQLVAAGVLMELIYKSATDEGKQRIKEQATKHLKDERNLKRVKAMFTRLDEDSSGNTKEQARQLSRLQIGVSGLFVVPNCKNDHAVFIHAVTCDVPGFPKPDIPFSEMLRHVAHCFSG